MKRSIATIILMFGLASCGRGRQESVKHVVLPNPELLRSCSSNRYPLWQESIADSNGIYPVQVTIDNFGNGGCPRGIVALYDKSVSVEDIKTVVDQRYGKWAGANNSTLPVKMWRVEPEKFAIGLAIAGTEMKEDPTFDHVLRPANGKNLEKEGMSQLFYLAFAGRE